jgi:hypothetical protein
MGRIVVLAVAIVIAATGGAYAAGTINGKDIKTGTVTGKQVKNHSLTPTDFKGSVRGPRGNTGPIGPAGAAGPAGTVAGTVSVLGPDVASGASGSGTNVQSSSAGCPAGTVVTGGGWDAGVRDFIANASPSGNGYFVIAVNTGSLASHIQAYAICGKGTPGAVATSVRSRVAASEAAAVARVRRLEARASAAKALPRR